MNELLTSYLCTFFLLMDIGQGWMLLTLSFSEAVCGFLEEIKWGLVLVTLWSAQSETLLRWQETVWMGFSCLKWHSVPALKYPTAALLLTATFRVEISCRSCPVCHSAGNVSGFFEHLKWHKAFTLKQLNPNLWVWEKSVSYTYSFSYLLLIKPQ